MMHAAFKRGEQPGSNTMVEALILLLFLISGSATGWMGVHLLPQELLDDVNAQGVRLGLTAPIHHLLEGVARQLVGPLGVGERRRL